MKTAAIATLIAATAFTVNAEESVRFADAFTAQNQTLHLDVGVGEVKVKASDDDQIRYEVEVKPSNNGWGWFKKDKVRQDLEVVVNRSNGVTRIELNEQEDVNQAWTVYLPQSMAFNLDIGVGDARINGVEGDINVDMGVGSVRVDGAHPDYSQVKLAAGVGDVSVSADINGSENRHVVGGDYSYRGQGDTEVKVDVGVGDVRLTAK
ncbi:hypothetical protein [Paraferrimonas sedimenticola]|uniref:Adhesin domain-containing protein n=1 Tax=Paraferrimonas sedimenticola TaxID=375674 RepID=A0AA37RTT7_9GAMM|nr:hypothetical protein [Paraferrimonas sedimenticola]GLP95166.1 hypothetical protein GCM10007895_04720 [Paraferrimonas sedimenticola]